MNYLFKKKNKNTRNNKKLRLSELDSAENYRREWPRTWEYAIFKNKKKQNKAQNRTTLLCLQHLRHT